MDGLYMADGSFQTFSHEELSSEIANRQNALAYSTDAWFGQLPDPDPILRKMGDEASILSELSADDQVTTAMLGRKNRVLNAPEYGYRAGSLDGEEPSAKAQHIYDNLKIDLERLNLRNLISGILDAPFYGIAPLEIIWESHGGWWHIKDIIPRPAHWFAFDEKNNPIFKGENGQNGFGTLEEKLLPAGKFVMVTHHASYDNPYGLRLLSRCLWPVTFKRGGIKFYAKFVERYGLPWTVGKAPAKATPEEKRKIAIDLARMVQDCVAVIPAGAEVSLLSADAKDSSLHESFISRQEKAISKLLMGQTLTVEMDGKNNSQAAATTHKDVAYDLAEADKAMVIDAMNEIAWIYTKVNMGKDVLAPLFTYEEPKDLQERALLDKELYAIGVRFSPSHFEEHYGLKEDEFYLMENEAALETTDIQNITGKDISNKDIASLEKSLSFSTANKSEFQEQIKNQRAFDAALKDLLPDAIKANDIFIKELLAEIETAKSLEDMELILIDFLAAKTELGEFENLLGTAMTKAASLGMYTISKEIEQEDG